MKGAFAVILTLVAIVGLHNLGFAQGPLESDSAQAYPVTDDDLVDDASPVARAARLRFVEGEVSFLRAGTSDWSDAAQNLPLLTGDQLYVGQNGRAEIQLSRGAFIRLLSETTLTITELSDTASQFEITEGTAHVKVNKLASPPYRFEIDTPNSALLLDADGLYSLTVVDGQRSEVIVSRGAAEVSTDDGTIRVKEGHRLAIDMGVTSSFELAADSGQDWWNDDWTTIANSAQSTSAPDDVTTYESDYVSFFGASDLASFGSWTNTSSYGYCWVPRVDSNWAPYRYGRWIWIPNAGWTWLADEQWGWAPYHYGRWAFVNGLGWAWVPGFGGYGRSYGGWDYRWRPSLVYFFNYPTRRGSYVGWCPLGPGQRWHRPEWYERHRDHRRPQNPSPANGKRPGRERRWIDPPRTPRAVTAVPVEAFQRPTRSVGKQEKLAPDTSDLIARTATPGLPAITPKGGAVQFNDGRARRRAITPSAEVLARPVVTRHRPANAEAETNAPRERKLVNPRPVNAMTNAITEDTAGGRQDKKGSQSRKSRITIPAPVDKTFGRGAAESRGSDGTNANVDQSKAERQERRRARLQEQQQATPVPPQNHVLQPSPTRIENRGSQQDHNNQTRAERKQERQERREARQERRAESGGRRKP